MPSPPSATEAAVAAEQVRKWLAKRDRAIRALRDEGWTLRAIAEETGLTHAGVARIIERT